MTDRVVAGLRSSGIGFFASKVGKNVDTASDGDLLLSSSFECFQFAQSGVIADPGNGATVTINFNNVGAEPYILLSSGKYKLTVPAGSRTSTSCQVQTENLPVNWGSNTPSGKILWAIIPRRWPY